jgi:hypothetical protein
VLYRAVRADAGWLRGAGSQHHPRRDCRGDEDSHRGDERCCDVDMEDEQSPGERADEHRDDGERPAADPRPLAAGSTADAPIESPFAPAIANLRKTTLPVMFATNT